MNCGEGKGRECEFAFVIAFMLPVFATQSCVYQILMWSDSAVAVPECTSDLGTDGIPNNQFGFFFFFWKMRWSQQDLHSPI